MSDVGKAAPVAQARLQGNSDLPIGQIQRHVDRYWRSELISKIRLPGGGGPSPEVAKYGVLGHTAAQMDVIVYDHPMMVKAFPTAFTDGRQIYFAAPFAQKLIEEEMTKGTQPGLFVMMHEAAHAAFGHCERRLKDIKDNQVKNIIFDTVINPRLVTSFPRVKPGSLRDFGLALTPDKIAQFKDMSEERAALLYEKDPSQFMPEPEDGDGDPSGKGGSGQGAGRQGKAGKTGKGSPGSGSGDPEGGEPGIGDGEAGDEEGDGGNHITTPEGLSKTLHEAGLGEVADKIGLPKPGDKAGFDKLRDGLQKQAQEVAQKVMRDASAAKAAGSRMPGAHLNDAYLEAIGLTLKPKLNWKIELRKALQLGGSRFGVHPDSPDEIRYVAPAVFGMESSPWVPSIAPTRRSDAKVLVITDTSGSMGSGELQQVIDEIYGMAKSATRDQPDIISYWADTALRGNPVQITARNLNQVFSAAKPSMNVAGRGGTHLHNCMQQAADRHAREFAQGKIAAIVYFSDLGDSPPAPPVIKGKMPQVIFVTMEGMNNPGFEGGVASYAKVVEINRGSTVQINDEPQPRAAASMSN